MRKLQAQDLFTAIRVINSADLKPEVKQMALLINEGELSVSEIGLEFILTVFEKISGSKSETAIYEFLAKPLECTPDKVREMELPLLIEKVKEIADVEAWQRFFKSVSALTAK